MDPGLFLPFGFCEWGCYEYECPNICWDPSFNFFWGWSQKLHNSSIFSFWIITESRYHVGNVQHFQHPHYPNALEFLCFVSTILMSVKRYLIVLSTCFSALISNIEHLFMCLLVMCIFYLEKCLFCGFIRYPYACWVAVSNRSTTWQYFLAWVEFSLWWCHPLVCEHCTFQ